MLTDDDIAYVNVWREIADMWAYRAKYIHKALDNAVEYRTMKGLEDMPAFAFNASQFNANFGSGGGQLPVGKHPVTITKTSLEPTKNNDGGKMVCVLTAFDGPAKGMSQTLNLNLQNKSAEAVRIANEQLAALLAVMGKPGHNMQNTEELHEQPFVVEIEPQANEPKYHEVKAVYTMDGRTPQDVVNSVNGGGQPQNNAFAGGGQGGGNAFGGAAGGQQGGGFGGGAGGGAAAGAGAGNGFGGGQQGGGQAQGGNGFGNGGSAGAGAAAGGAGGGSPAWGGAGGGQAQGGGSGGAWGAR